MDIESRTSSRLAPLYLTRVAALSLWLAGAVAFAAPPPGPSHPLTATVSGNLGDIKNALKTYHDSGQYMTDLAKVDTAAADYLLKHLTHVDKPAVVFDIDETSLSNWPQLVANDFAYFAKVPCNALPQGPCGSEDWDELEMAPAIGPTLQLFKTAKAHNVAVFFITGRFEKERRWTEDTLHKVGFDQWAELVMRRDGTKAGPAAAYKAPERQRIQAMGYTIIVNVGDQPSDLEGGLAEKAFLLPNPFYRIP